MDYTSEGSHVSAMASGARALFVAARPKQWTKNLMVFLAVLFSVNEAWLLGDVVGMLRLFGTVAIAFLVFSTLSSAVYLLNDVVDVERDRNHPKKMHRPIASGMLSVGLARAASVALAIIGWGIAFWMSPWFGIIALAYVASNIAYSLVLKRVVILDVFIIGSGFVLRVIAGAVVISAPISPWLYLCTGLAALLIALIKRRSELVTAGDTASEQRESLSQYSVPMLDQLITVTATSSVLAYSLYTFTAPNLPPNGAMMLTIPFVVFGLFRYLFLVHSRNMGENIEEAVSDLPIAISVALWLGTAIVVLGLMR